MDVGFRIKGRAGSFRTLDRKSAFKVKIDFSVPDQRFLGMKKLTLNNMVQDRAMVHEWLAYTLFRGMGVASPRTGYAKVWLNGDFYGLYSHIETLDDVMLDRWFASTVHLYEGAYGADLFPNQENNLEPDEGDPLDRSDLTTVINLLHSVDPADFYDVSQALIDWPQVLSTMVTEIYIGHWDGYAPTRNNYYFHFDNQGVMRLLPWGTDQTFDRHLAWRDGRGLLLERCRASLGCMMAFDLTLLRLVRLVDELDLVPAIRAQADLMFPWVVEDPASSTRRSRSRPTWRPPSRSWSGGGPTRGDRRLPAGGRSRSRPRRLRLRHRLPARRSHELPRRRRDLRRWHRSGLQWRGGRWHRLPRLRRALPRRAALPGVHDASHLPRRARPLPGAGRRSGGGGRRRRGRVAVRPEPAGPRPGLLAGAR
ncbi:MAG: CotH kinase family protein [bacterium]